MTENRDLSPPDILILKTSTSGLYRSDISIDDPAQPWCPEISAALCNSAGVMVQHFSHVIKSDGRTVKDNAAKVHGITARASSQVGIPEKRVLGIFTDMLATATFEKHMRVVTFGDMDRMVLASLFSRFAIAMGKKSIAYDMLWLSRPRIEFIDLQKPYAQQLCKIPGEFEGAGWKWPSLAEASEIILKRQPADGIRDAWSDLVTIKELYFHFHDAGLMEQEVAA